MKAAGVLPAAIRAVVASDPELWPGVDVLLPFLRGASVHVDPGTPTASIRRAGRRWRIQVGPAFAEEHVLDDTDALILVAHECMHALRGHFGLPPCREPWRAQLQNLALDILVNAALARTVTSPPLGLLARLYPLDQFPGCLLRPPSDLLAAGGPTIPADLAGLDFDTLARLWARPSARRSALTEAVRLHLAGLGLRNPDRIGRLWLDGWLTVPEPSAWWVRFQAAFSAEGGHWRVLVETLLMLGDHDHDGDSSLDDHLGSLLPGAGGACQAAQSPVARSNPAWRAFLDRVRRVVERDPRAKALNPSPDPSVTVLPRVGRREAAAVALGHPPAFYALDHPVERRAEAGVRIYLDVSGSTEHVAPLFFGVANVLGEALCLPAWAWSTEVHPLTIGDLRHGRFRGTGGTSISCVIRHARAHGFRRILVLTDGELFSNKNMVRDVRAHGPRMVFLLARRGKNPFWSFSVMKDWREMVEGLAEEIIDVPPEVFRSEFEDMPYLVPPGPMSLP